jgi:hypothetical protein
MLKEACPMLLTHRVKDKRAHTDRNSRTIILVSLSLSLSFPSLSLSFRALICFISNFVSWALICPASTDETFASSVDHTPPVNFNAAMPPRQLFSPSSTGTPPTSMAALASTPSMYCPSPSFPAGSHGLNLVPVATLLTFEMFSFRAKDRREKVGWEGEIFFAFSASERFPLTKKRRRGFTQDDRCAENLLSH